MIMSTCQLHRYFILFRRKNYLYFHDLNIQYKFQCVIRIFHTLEIKAIQSIIPTKYF